jgi:hypothetical protein
MKTDEKDSSAKTTESSHGGESSKSKEANLPDQPSTSTAGTSTPSPESSSSKDALFEVFCCCYPTNCFHYFISIPFQPTIDMMVNDFDDEQTLEEEERLEKEEQKDPNAELSDLQREGEMPIEELLKLYGAPGAGFASTSSSGTSRKRRRRPSPKPAKKAATENLTDESTAQAATTEEAGEESAEEDATTTTTTNNLENQSLDDETNFDEDEPSELTKLYEDAKDGSKLDQSLSDEEEDLDYSPDEDEAKKTIMVGGDYQAVIPEGMKPYDDALPYENEDKLLWDPSKLSDSDIEEYLNKFSKLASANGGTNYISQGGKHLRDDEQALHLLLQCGNNVEEALRRRKLGGIQPPTTMSIWSEEECRNFENGLRVHGKCFHEIQASKVSDSSEKFNFSVE